MRHKPEVVGIELDEHGWADVDELISGISKKYPFDFKTLERIVREDKKGRYTFNEDKTLIRANQGHSIPVDVELKEVDPPEYLWHGTGERSVDSINKKGILKMSRLYVHLSTDSESAKKVGKRHGKPRVYRIESQRMKKDGYKFYLSKNGVWLTKTVPVKYIQLEED